MNNTITAASQSNISKFQPDAKWQRRSRLVKWSGYAALGFGTVCGVTGFKTVKFPHKHTVHKYSAYLAGITSFLHLGFIKGLDRIFDKKETAT